MTSLTINNLCKQFSNKIVLDHAECSFEEGKIYSVLGRNGAGKTTLFNCINGDLVYENGEVLINSEGQSRKLKFDDVGLVSASPILPDFLTGYEFIHYFINLNESQKEQDIDSFFDLVRIEEADRHKLIKTYSYGMKNKLQLLCCLLRNPKIVLLDEPLSSFDIVVSHDIKELLIQMKSTHIIMATHIMQLAQDVSDEIVLLRKGKLSLLKLEDIHTPDFEEFIIKELCEVSEK